MATAPRTARPKPQDHLPSAQTAARREALGEGTVVEFNGDTYIVRPSSEWDIDVLSHQRGGAPDLALKLILGDEDFARFTKKNRTLGSLAEMVNAIVAAAGTGN